MSSHHKTGSNRIASAELRQFIERIERLETERSEIADHIKAVKAEAKSRGYATKYMAAIIKLRKMAPSDREEDAAMLDLYMSALGMAQESPLFRHVEGMAVDVTAREAVIDALRLLAPEDGEITIRVGNAPRMRLTRTKGGEVTVEEVRPTAAHQRSPDGADTLDRPGGEAPDCTEAEAFELGRSGRKSDAPVIANPFAWNDPRRRKWDEGWREEDGGDGMGPAG